MAQQDYKIDLQSTDFTMLSEQQSRTVIGGSAREAASSEGLDRNRPGIAYCHNVMPTKYGMKSISFEEAVPAIVGLGAGERVEDTRTMYGDAGTRIELTWDSEGNTFALRYNTTAWIAVPTPTPDYTGAGFLSSKITTAKVNGVGYLFYSGLACYTYNETTNALEEVTLTGISVGGTLGVASYAGYLMTYTSKALAWSSTIDPTDFTPSAVTGAGGGKIDGISGLIITVVHNNLGILIHARNNIIAGTYTGNIQYPFKFREVEGSRGGGVLGRISFEDNSAKQYVFNDAGLQAVDSQRAQGILPEVSDFLTGRMIETYNTTTNQFDLVDIVEPNAIRKKLNLVSSRYLLISYGNSTSGVYQTHALIYDTSLQKLGKVLIDHTDTLEYVWPQGSGDQAKHSIGFLQEDGAIQTVNYDVGTASDGVLILGKLQYTRTRMMTLLAAEVENVRIGVTFSLSDRMSLDGKVVSSVVSGYEAHNVSDLRIYNFHATGKNHSLLLKGEFHATSVQISYSIHGRR